MEIKDAIDLVVLAKGRFLDDPLKYEALHMGKEALEKQKPLPVQIKNGWWSCPKCKECLNNDYGNRVAYCEYCGQRIDWSKS